MRRPEPPGLESLTPSQVEWVNTACNEFEEEWGRNLRPTIEDYLKRGRGDAEINARLVLLRELLTIELELREEDAKAHDLDGYRAQFTDPIEIEVVEFVLGEAAKQESARRFRIVKPHAHGGLGEVFVAHDEQLDRQVALKRIRPELAEHESSRARFIGEAEITGRLEHPNIAPVYALGRDRDKRPCYAMRFIDGAPFDQVIENFHRAHAAGGDPGKRQLELRKLLANLIAVCNAVAFAHNRGVVHRDVKPHNIVLGPFGETVLVDWGLAKELGAPASDAGARLVQEEGRNGNGLSEVGSLLGTLGYMSPEQAEPKSKQVGPATDIYSLGATLFHLLTGRPPFAGTDHEELRREVIQGEFLTPREVDRTVPPALEAIVLKAMAHEPGDRYATATALAEDIEHWLADEPVAAWREPLSIRVRRGMRRHRTLAASVAAGILVGLAGLAASAIVLAGKNRELEGQRLQVVEQLNRAVKAEQVSRDEEAKTKKSEATARKERDRAESEAAIAKAVNEFFNKDVLAQAAVHLQIGPNIKPDPNLTVRTALDRSAGKIGERFAGQPLVEASIRQTIGEAYFHLGLYAQALTHLERARDLRRRELGEDHADTMETMSAIGTVYREDGKLSQAEPLLVQAMNGLRRALGAEHPRTLAATLGVAQLYFAQGKLLEAEQLLLTLREVYQRTHGAEALETLDVTNSLAVVYEYQNKLEPAARLLSQAQKTLSERFGVQHPGTLSAIGNLASVYKLQGKRREAERLWKEVLEKQRSMLGDKHPETLASMAVLGQHYVEDRRLDEAEPLLVEALAGSRTALDRNHEVAQLALLGLAGVYTQKRVMAKLGPVLMEALQVTLVRNGPDHGFTAIANYNVGAFCLVQKDYVRAEPYLREHLSFFVKNDPEHWSRFASQSMLGRCLMGQKKYAEAEQHLLSAYNGMKPRAAGPLPANPGSLRRAVEWIAQLYDEWGEKDKAKEWSRRFDELAFPKSPFAPPQGR